MRPAFSVDTRDRLGSMAAGVIGIGDAVGDTWEALSGARDDSGLGGGDWETTALGRLKNLRCLSSCLRGA